MRIKKDPTFLPEEQDFKLLQKIYDEGSRIRIKATYIEALLHQRLKGGEEISLPWSEEAIERE